MLRLQYEDYAQILGPAYHALKTSDHVSRYRRDIVTQLQNWQLDGGWLNQTADELATQGRYTPSQSVEEINRYLSFIINQLETLDPLLDEIDRRHAQYLRTSLRQVRYQFSRQCFPPKKEVALVFLECTRTNIRILLVCAHI